MHTHTHIDGSKSNSKKKRTRRCKGRPTAWGFAKFIKSICITLGPIGFRSQFVDRHHMQTSERVLLIDIISPLHCGAHRHDISIDLTNKPTSRAQSTTICMSLENIVVDQQYQQQRHHHHQQQQPNSN